MSLELESVDFLVIGGGVAGLRAAIELAPHGEVLVATKDIPAERMITMERSLGLLASTGQVDSLEAEKWANQSLAFLAELKYLQQPEDTTAQPDA